MWCRGAGEALLGGERCGTGGRRGSAGRQWWGRWGGGDAVLGGRGPCWGALGRQEVRHPRVGRERVHSVLGGPPGAPTEGTGWVRDVGSVGGDCAWAGGTGRSAGHGGGTGVGAPRECPSAPRWGGHGRCWEADPGRSVPLGGDTQRGGDGAPGGRQARGRAGWRCRAGGLVGGAAASGAAASSVAGPWCCCCHLCVCCVLFPADW